METLLETFRAVRSYVSDGAANKTALETARKMLQALSRSTSSTKKLDGDIRDGVATALAAQYLTLRDNVDPAAADEWLGETLAKLVATLEVFGVDLNISFLGHDSAFQE